MYGVAKITETEKILVENSFTVSSSKTRLEYTPN
jgi:hypothetical protein